MFVILFRLQVCVTGWYTTVGTVALRNGTGQQFTAKKKG